MLSASSSIVQDSLSWQGAAAAALCAYTMIEQYFRRVQLLANSDVGQSLSEAARQMYDRLQFVITHLTLDYYPYLKTSGGRQQIGSSRKASECSGILHVPFLVWSGRSADRACCIRTFALRVMHLCTDHGLISQFSSCLSHTTGQDSPAVMQQCHQSGKALQA